LRQTVAGIANALSFETTPKIFGQNEAMTENWMSFRIRRLADEKSVPFMKDFSSFFVEMTILAKRARLNDEVGQEISFNFSANYCNRIKNNKIRKWKCIDINVPNSSKKLYFRI